LEKQTAGLEQSFHQPQVKDKFAAGFMGKFLKLENTYSVRVAKDAFEKSSGGGFFGCGRLRGQVYSKTRMRPSSSGTYGSVPIDD
jgi:hypothetical protein